MDVLGERSAETTSATTSTGGGGGAAPISQAPFPNILEERQDVRLTQVNARLNEAFLQLFFGDPDTEAVFRDLGDGTGYIEDVFHGDTRTDAMANGLLATVQLDQREVFDKLWSWCKQYMMSSEGPREGLLMWRCNFAGDSCDTFGVTDASSIVATSLLIAESRWGATGAHSYESDGLALLEAMTTVEERNGGVVDGVRNMFDLEAALPRPTSGGPIGVIDPDFLMPAFYELWAERDASRAEFWRETAANSRALLAQAPHPENGLLPSTLNYDGSIADGESDYGFTSARTYMLLAIDHAWHGPFDWIEAQNERVLDFFLAEGIDDYSSEYTREGQPLTTYNTVAHISLVATAAGTSSNPDHDIFLERLLEQETKTGELRYYDGMIYLLSLLTLSGQMARE